MDAPEVDGKVYLSDDFDAKPGDQIWVQIIHADEHDVWGVRVEEE
jgi:ribosomal protein S12 methylthiotransferase